MDRSLSAAGLVTGLFTGIVGGLFRMLLVATGSLGFGLEALSWPIPVLRRSPLAARLARYSSPQGLLGTGTALAPHWRDRVPFHEHFHADTGRGLGANH